MNMNFAEIIKDSIAGKQDKGKIQRMLVNVYEDSLALLDKHRDVEQIWDITEAIAEMSAFLPRLGQANMIVTRIVDDLIGAYNQNKLDNLKSADYNRMTKSSKIYERTIKIDPSISPFVYLQEAIERLYGDLSKRVEALRYISSNEKFAIENGLADATVKKTPKEYKKT